MEKVDIDLPKDDESSFTAVLPPEILQMIFIRLDVHSKCLAAQVSKSWREMVYQEAVWQDVTVSLYLNSKCSNVALSSLENRKVQKARVFLIDKSGYRLRAMLHFLPLRSLNFGSCVNFTSGALLRALDNPLANLTELQLRGCHYLTNRCIREVTRKCPNLRKLDLQWCSRLTGDALIHVGNGLPELTALDIQGCFRITGASISHLIGSPVSRGNRKLQFLGLQHCKIVAGDLRNIAENFPTLGCLHLHSVDEMTVDALSHLAGMGSLRELKMTNSNLEDSILTNLPQSKITVLDLSANNLLSGAGMCHVARMPYLQTLIITYCNIDDSGLEHFGRNHSKIVSINLEGNYRITDVGLEHLSKLVELNSLNLSRCPAITATGLLALAGAAPNIQNINVSGCSLPFHFRTQLPGSRCPWNVTGTLTQMQFGEPKIM